MKYIGHLLILLFSFQAQAYELVRDCDIFVNNGETQDQRLPDYVDFYFQCKDLRYPVEAYSKVQVKGGLKYRKLIHVHQDGKIFGVGYSIENENFLSIDSMKSSSYFTITTSLDEKKLNEFYPDKIVPFLNCLKKSECSLKVFKSVGFFYRVFDKDYKKFVSDYKLNEFDSFSYDIFNNFRIENEFFSFIFKSKNNRKWLVKAKLWGGGIKLESVNQVL